jgi:L-alanine-DL-glutamate epimerase-like enolase superfamily enzyme
MMNELTFAEEKGLKDVYVFQVCECDAVAGYSLDEAIEWYKNLTGLEDDELYSYEDVETTPFDYTVRKSEDEFDVLISVGEILETYWESKPFIVFSTL